MTKDEYQIWKALQTIAHEQAMLEQEQARAIKAEIKLFVKRTVMWFFILLALLIVIVWVL
jgi:hypothetical protein